MGHHAALAPVVPRLVDEPTAAAYLGHGRTAFRKAVEEGHLPGPCLRNGNRPLWDLRALDRHVDALSGIAARPAARPALADDFNEWDDVLPR